jgi:hypothetical protein
VRHSIQERLPNIVFCQFFPPRSLGTRVRGIFSIGRMWAVIVRPNDRHGSRQHQHREAGGDSGSNQRHRPHGYADDAAVECEGRANLRCIRGMERHPADERYRDHRSLDCDHELHADLQRSRRVGVSIG